MPARCWPVLPSRRCGSSVLALRLLGNTALGFAALWCVRATAALTGITLGLNTFNALVIGILGLPGFVLLLLTQWVL